LLKASDDTVLHIATAEALVSEAQTVDEICELMAQRFIARSGDLQVRIFFFSCWFSKLCCKKCASGSGRAGIRA
jgi:hypothetical protein